MANLPLPPMIALTSGATEAPPAMVAEIIDQLISTLDAAEDDPDLETTGTEDDFMDHEPNGPGCPIADPDDDVGDRIDRSHAEWHTLPTATRRAGKIDGTLLPGIWSADEEAEEDDPAGQCDEDGINTELRVLKADYGPGCIISDSDYGGEEAGESEDGI